MPKAGRYAARILLCLVTVTITLGAVELFMRLTGLKASPPGYENMPDPVLGWRLRPGVRSFRHGRSDIRINSHGWRDVEHDYDKPKGTFRIAVLGDSFMYAGNIDDVDALFTRRLERALEASGQLGKHRAVEVLNFGIPGYGTFQEYLVFKHEAVRYGPDIVLLAFFAQNDLYNNSRDYGRTILGPDTSNYYSRPFLVQNDDGAWETVPPDYERAKSTYEKHRALLDSRVWWKRTALYSLLANAGPSFRSPNRRPKVALNVSLAPYLCEEPPFVTEAWEITEEIFVRLDEAVGEAGARLLVFAVPTFFETEKELTKSNYKHPGQLKILNSPAFCFDDVPPYKRLSGLLAEHEIPYIDLLPLFRSAVRTEGRSIIISKRDYHWNAFGHGLAAQGVAAALLEGAAGLP